VRDPSKPKTPLVEEARRELVKSFRSIVWAQPKRPDDEESRSSSDHEAGTHVS
jgi:hypothetical protein